MMMRKRVTNHMRDYADKSHYRSPRELFNWREVALVWIALGLLLFVRFWR